MVAGAPPHGGDLIEGLAAQLFCASTMLHNHVSERRDLVACGILRRILYCIVHALSPVSQGQSSEPGSLVEPPRQDHAV